MAVKEKSIKGNVGRKPSVFVVWGAVELKTGEEKGGGEKRVAKI